MAVKTANLGAAATKQLLVTGAATVYGITWAGGLVAGSVKLFDGTATTDTNRLTVNTVGATAGHGGAGDTLPIGGGGLHFNTSIFANPSNTGGFTIVYATGIRG